MPPLQQGALADVLLSCCQTQTEALRGMFGALGLRTMSAMAQPLTTQHVSLLSVLERRISDGQDTPPPVRTRPIEALPVYHRAEPNVVELPSTSRSFPQLWANTTRDMFPTTILDDLDEIPGSGSGWRRRPAAEPASHDLYAAEPASEATHLHTDPLSARAEQKLKQQHDLEQRAREQAAARWKRLMEAQRRFGTPRFKDSREVMRSWLDAVTVAIQQEQDACLAGTEAHISAKDSAFWGPALLLVKAEDLALLAVQTMMAMCLLPPRYRSNPIVKQQGRSTATSIANELGTKVNSVALQLLMQRKVEHLQAQQKSSTKKGGQQKLGEDLSMMEQRFVELAAIMQPERDPVDRLGEIEKALSVAMAGKKGAKRRKAIAHTTELMCRQQRWPADFTVKVGAKLAELVLKHAQVAGPGGQLEPAFVHSLMRTSRTKTMGVISLAPPMAELLSKDEELFTTMRPEYGPMVVPPVPWTQRYDGGYLTLKTKIVRDANSQRIKQLWKEKEENGGLQQLYTALNALSSTAWQINKEVYGVVSQLWEGLQQGELKLPSRVDLPVPTIPKQLPFRCVVEKGQLVITGGPPLPTEQRRYALERGRIKQLNVNLASLRAEVKTRLTIAREFLNEEAIYYPHNVDFRGRAYPIHAHLHHLGDDVCRGLLRFAEAKPLGPSGLDWLYIHLTNMWGNGQDKLPLQKRCQFAKDNLVNILSSANRPLEGDQWWKEAEKPWQALATCMEIRNALAHPGREAEYRSRLPVYQDGSCNGLQHYAALGRDAQGGMAVNLTPSSKPHDVYQEVANLVAERVETDAAAAHGEALKLLAGGGVDRKLVKQTVMTSVYGVTAVGAREQVANRLRERGWTNEGEIFKVAWYVSKLTMQGIAKLFTNARFIMDWLSKSAQLVAKEGEPMVWTTPIGIPVLQPYYTVPRKRVPTVVQNMSLKEPDNHKDARVYKRGQKTAFPPNYIHSLDSAHMMRTAVSCNRAGLCFAGVHDSFWTHAGDVDTMNRILREEFVALHREPLLEHLLAELQEKNPNVDFLDIPKRGRLNLDAVLKSTYFFS